MYLFLLEHYYGKCGVALDRLKKEYNRLAKLSSEDVTKDSPIKPGQFTNEGSPQTYYNLNRYIFPLRATEETITKIINSLDTQNRWLAKHARISHPYIGEGQKQEQTYKYASTNVGDETDTSPFDDLSDQEYISTNEYIKNMKTLINYVESVKHPDGSKKSVLWH